MRKIYTHWGMYFGCKPSLTVLISHLQGIDFGALYLRKNRGSKITNISEFNKWYEKNHKFKLSVHGTDYILIVLANNDEKLALDIFWKEYIKFLKEIYNIDFLSIKTTIIGFNENGEAIWE